MKQFKLPDVGEGLTEAEVVSWKVKPGDTVKVNEIIVEIETAKSLVELPCPYAGTVTELLVDEGQTVDVGTPIITVDDGTGPSAGEGGQPARQLGTDSSPSMAPALPADASAVATPGDEEAVEPGLIGGPAPGGRTSVLVGYGPKTTTATRRPRKAGAGASASAQTATQAVQTSMMTSPVPVREPHVDEVEHAAPLHVGNGGTNGSAKVLAKPPVRKLARDLGVDLTTLTPSGPGGVVTREDVEAASNGSAAAVAPSRPTSPAYQAFDASREQRIPVKGVRKMTAQAMVTSAFTAPHVTEWVTIDVTRTVELVERLRGDREFRDVRVSPLLVVAKALMLAIRRNPGMNASWDEAAQEIVVKEYVNLGIAAATPRGLLVPNIKGADAMTLAELGRAINDLTDVAREGRTAPADQSGGTITITNVGVFGVDSGTPIINPGEAAILCLGAIRDMPWVVDGQVVPRKVTQLAVSFDHRMIDGELGSRFLSDLAAILEDPAQALVWA